MSHAQWLLALEAGATMLVPNRLLANEVQKSFACYQRGKGVVSWHTPRVSIIDVWRRGVCLRWLEQNNDYRVLMSNRQVQALWEATITAHLPDVIKHTQPQAFISDMARSAHQAWNLSFEWMLDDKLSTVYLNKDQLEFNRWRNSFVANCERRELLDVASVFSIIVGQAADMLVASAERESSLWFFGFDNPSKLETKLLTTLADAGVDTRLCSPVVSAGKNTHYEFDDLTEELSAAAGFAKRKITQSTDSRVAVLLPSVNAKRKLVKRLFVERFYGDTQTDEASLAIFPMAFEMVSGEPVTSEPIVSAAINLLQFVISGVDAETFTSLVLSPFVGGAQSESLVRAQWDVRFRKRAYERLQLHELNKELASEYCPECPPLLRAIFTRLTEHNTGSAKKMSGDWAEDFDQILKQCGWPGERTLTEAEQQAVSAFSETLDKQLELNLLNQKTDAAGALSSFKQTLDSVVIRQPKADVCVQIMSPDEAIGQTFDAVWMAGFDDKQWPPALTPNPFLPRKLLEQSGAPDGSQVLGHKHYSAVTQSLLSSAAEVVVSSSRQQDGLDVNPSVLIEHIPSADFRFKSAHDAEDINPIGQVVEEWTDEQGMPLSPSLEPYPGGVGVFKNQSDCAFKAYAINRLGVSAPLQVEPALTALERGGIVHDALMRFWGRVDSQKALNALSDEMLMDVIASSVDTAIKRFSMRHQHRLSPERANAERRRLCNVLGEWMEQERKRADDFYIEEVETPIKITVGELTVAGKVDRIDATPNGSVLIDYKIGKKSKTSWQGERPDEPQLPLYRYAYGDIVNDIAFANLKRDDAAYVRASKKNMQAEEWSQMTQEWDTALERLASEFKQGEATVDPRKPDVCNFCELTSFCRRTELLGASDPEDTEEV